VQLTLTNDEAKTLAELLDAVLPDLREELKRREALVKSLLGRLKGA
jgi:hypothetical protein